MASDKAQKNSDKSLPKPALLAALGSILSIGLVAAIAALFFFAWLAGEVLEGDTKVFDENVRNFVHKFATENLTVLMQIATMSGSTIFLSIVAVVVVAIFLRTGHRHSAAVFSVTMVGAVILNIVLKLTFMRDRPSPFFDTPLPSSYSFPSGHALCSLCFYGSLAWIYAAHVRSKLAQGAMWFFAALLIFLIGLSRVYLGVHYPSDVLAGYAAAFVWLSAVIWADTLFNKRKNRRG